MFKEENFYKFSWRQLLGKDADFTENNYDESNIIEEYHHILCPIEDYPQFLKKYLELPMLQRLKGIGLLCGSDWTKLFNNRFFYSRYDHSVGVALIIWHFTHSKEQTVAGLLHDVSTPVFSHVSDFRKGDALTQTSTEEENEGLIRGNSELAKLLTEDGLCVEAVEDYHKYPVADNEIPQLSSDRLEYMFPSGMVLEGSWSLEEINSVYKDLSILKNEENRDELGFNSLDMAELYCYRFCKTGHILQRNEDKLTLHMLGQIMNKAVDEGLLEEQDFMTKNETQIFQKITGKGSEQFKQLLNTFINMEEIKHTDEPLKNHFCVNLRVKQRYINPLVKTANGNKRLFDISEKSKQIISTFLSFEDTAFGCVKLQ